MMVAVFYLLKHFKSTNYNMKKPRKKSLTQSEKPKVCLYFRCHSKELICNVSGTIIKPQRRNSARAFSPWSGGSQLWPAAGVRLGSPSSPAGPAPCGDSTAQAPRNSR